MELRAGQVAVVTGATGDLGRALARRLAAEGLRVVLADTEEEPLRALADELIAGGAELLARTVDVGEWAEVEALAGAAYDTFGAVHVLCNNAGTGRGAPGPLWEHDPADWRRSFEANVLGVLHGVRCFLPRMVASGEPGHVVNSAAADGGCAPSGAASVPAATGAAVVALTETLRAQLAAAGAPVGASVLVPGPYALDGAGPPASPAAVAEVAGRVVAGIRGGRFWIRPPGAGAEAE